MVIPEYMRTARRVCSAVATTTAHPTERISVMDPHYDASAENYRQVRAVAKFKLHIDVNRY